MKKLDYGEAAFNMLYERYRQRAENKKIPFDLSIKQFKKLTSDACYYCGIIPNQTMRTNNGSYMYNGIDRADNTQGYTMDNVVTACKKCNYMKGTLGQEEFILRAMLIANKHTWKDRG